MKKILLLNPPGDRPYIRDYYCSHVSKGVYYWPGYDLLVLSGILSKEYRVEVLDAIISRMSFEECFSRIKEMDIDVIIFITGSVSWREDFSFLEKVKKEKKVLMIASGDFLLFQGSKIMRQFPFLDAVILDFTTRNILDFLGGEGNEKKDNLIIRKGEDIIEGNKITIKEFEIPIPRHELFPLNKYSLPHLRRHPFASVLTAFGCPYQCLFCPFQRIPFKTRKIENILEEFTYISSLGIKEIWFRDQTFLANKLHSLKLCKEMIEKKFAFSWSCETRVDLLDEETLKVMKAAGCHTVMLGVESARQDILDRYKKGIKIDRIKEAFALCKKLKIKTLAHFIIGLPGEDEESQRELIDLAKQIDCDYASFNIASPQIGTTFRDQAISKGWISEKTDIMDSSCSYPLIETKSLSKEKVWMFHQQAVREFYMRPRFLLNRICRLKSIKEGIILLKEGIYFLREIFFVQNQKR